MTSSLSGLWYQTLPEPVLTFDNWTNSSQWCHNECDCVSNHQPHNCLLNYLFKRISKKTSRLHVTGLCARNSPVTGEFPAQRASNADNVSIWCRHHVRWNHNQNSNIFFHENVFRNAVRKMSLPRYVEILECNSWLWTHHRKVSIVTADALVPSVIRSSAAIMLQTGWQNFGVFM